MQICHSERSEESGKIKLILRYAQNDKFAFLKYGELSAKNLPHLSTKNDLEKIDEKSSPNDLTP